MPEPVAMPVPPKKAKGFWTPWGNFRVPNLETALENQSALQPKRLPNALQPEHKPADKLKRS